jgi:hypothetical protein
VTAAITGATTSATFTLTNLDFTIAQAVPGMVQVTAGTPANVALLLTTTPTGSNLPADVSFSCVAQAPQSSTACAINPAKFSAGSVSGSATMLTIKSTANSIPAPRRQFPHVPYLPWTIATALAGLIAIYFAAQPKIVPMKGREAYLTLVLLGVTVTGLVGCVGLTGANSPVQNGSSSSVIVTAASQGVSRTATVTITVK